VIDFFAEAASIAELKVIVTTSGAATSIVAPFVGEVLTSVGDCGVRTTSPSLTTVSGAGKRGVDV